MMSHTRLLAIFPLAALLFAPDLLSLPANAQMSANPPEVGAKIRAMGAKLNRDIIVTTSKLYGPLHGIAPREGVRTTLDQAYGPHERHRLDVYRPDPITADPRPVVVFLHGGGFVRGDKGRARNIGTYFARHGMVGIMANYRLAPKSNWPSGAEDVASIIKWIKSNGANFSGDARKIFLMGNSAGTSHVASYVFFEKFQIRDDGVAGAILVSGPTYDLGLNVAPSGVLGHPGERGYYGADSAKYAGMSSVRNVGGRKIPLFIAYAELDIPVVQRQNMALIDAIYKRDNRLPTVKQVIGHNHISIVLHINTKDESLGPDVLEFIRSR